MRPPLPPDAPPAPAERTGTGTVLVVDDDQRNVRLMESILRGSGYQVVKAYNGEEALRLVETSPPDMLLLDVMMPRMSGFELCQKLKPDAAGGGTKVVTATVFPWVLLGVLFAACSLSQTTAGNNT